MLVREVGELLRSIDSPSISNPNENRSESLPAWLVVVFSFFSGRPSYTHAPARMLLDEAKPIHTIGEGKTPT